MKIDIFYYVDYKKNRCREKTVDRYRVSHYLPNPAVL
jgi:hypothetical protein